MIYALLSVTLVALFQLNETERRAYIISLKGLDVMDKSASELSGLSERISARLSDY